MVNELAAQNWAYLLDPCFQLVNSKGAPLTGGYLEVFYHGTRTPYYCGSDFNGTLHPFKIPLDSLGSNVVLADPNFSYDVYVYNKYGVLKMSRYDVNPGLGGSGSGSTGEGGPAQHWTSDPSGGASSSVTGGTNVYLTLPSSEDQPEFVDHTTDTAIFLKEGLYHIDAVVSFKQDDEDLQNIIKDLVVNTGLLGWDAQMTGQKNWTGPESTDDDRHFLELHTVVSVPEDLLQPLYFQIASPVDLDSAAIEKLDIIKLEAGGNGIQYAAGYGIDITGQVISTSGMMPEASAANFVDNSTYQVDIQNIYDTIAETSAMIPSGVATEQWVEDYVASATTNFVTTEDLDGYATQDWVVDQGYLTSADLPQSVPLVAGEGISIIDTSASTIISVDSAYSPGVSEEWVEEYVSDYTSAFITSADIPDVPEDLVTSAELATVSGDIVSQIPSLDGYATEEWVGEQGYLTSLPEDLVTSGELATVSGDIVNQIPDVSDMATQTWVNEQGFLTSIPEDIVTSGELATVSGNIMNEIPDTSDMATQTWVGQQGYLTSIPAEYATSGDLVTLSGAIEAEIPSYTAGDNISIVNDEISVSGTAGLIAGENIAITASGENYVISSTGGGGSGSDVFYAIIGTTTFSDVWDAVSSGKTVYAVPSGEDPTATGAIGTEVYRLIQIFNVEGGTALFEQLNEAGDDIRVTFRILYQDDDTWGELTRQGSLVPAIPVDEGKVLTTDGEGYAYWAAPAGGGSEVDIIPSLSSGTKIADFVIDGTSGELYAPAGGGSVTFPLEVSGSTNVYEARDGLTSGYVNAGEIYVGYHDDNGGGGEPDLDTVKLTPYMVEVKGDWGGSYPNITNVTPQGLEIYDDQGQGHYVDGTSIDYWNDAAFAFYSSANNWNSAYNAINDSASYWNDAAGMNEYPISAGPGMSIEDVSGVTVFSTDVPAVQAALGEDRTVLFEGEMSGTLPVSGALLEPTSGFNTIEMVTKAGNKYWFDGGTERTRHAATGIANGTIYNYAFSYHVQDANRSISLEQGRAAAYRISGNSISNYENLTTTNYSEVILTKVVGIGRKENS